NIEHIAKSCKIWDVGTSRELSINAERAAYEYISADSKRRFGSSAIQRFGKKHLIQGSAPNGAVYYLYFFY
ncbi:MAG TPA: hypothetical protein VK590_09140, partial [Saprospiraceae bacterium]|nr:hypothetical protein [Saprospiraceae bacterium]